MRRLLLLSLAGAAALVLACSDDRPSAPDTDSDEVILSKFEADDSAGPSPVATDWSAGVGPTVRTYEIVIENLAPATGPGASQPFSPPVIATHRGGMHLFRAGRFASGELAQVAEDAVNGPLVGRLQNANGVFAVVEGGGVILPGDEARFEIQTAHGKRLLSLVFMLVNTNDAFGGADAIPLPAHGERVVYLHAYDAGSEQNTERTTDIPGPCCGNPLVRVPTHERIRRHGGILGVGDLDPATYGWDEPVARLTVRRIRPTYEVTIENITPATVPGGSQPFSPPILATHWGGVRMYRVGHFASDALVRIAEDGDASVMAAMLGASHKVVGVTTGSGPILPGASATFEVEGPYAFGRLAAAFMLVNTNDAFSGVSRLRLPHGGSAEYLLGTYDAGSEENTESAAHIPGPCCGNPGVRVPTHEPIAMHGGIVGSGDLDPADYGWTDPAARLTITRVK
ncbi:MAG: spondin domain-containing protein [Candidatus Krumholzibacteria bacterium]|nr:spondin domain-containing protein [Candidatus Krumholzibacteria bacterium]